MLNGNKNNFRDDISESIRILDPDGVQARKKNRLARRKVTHFN